MATVKEIKPETKVQSLYYVDKEEKCYYMRLSGHDDKYISLSTGFVYSGAITNHLTPLPVGTRLELVL